MLTITEKEILKRITQLAALEENLTEREMIRYKKKPFKERPRDDMGRWLPKEGETSFEEMEEESPYESTRKIKVVKDKEKAHSYDVVETGFNIEDLKSLLAVIGVLATFIYVAMT